MFLVTIAGHTSAKTPQGTLRNELYYSQVLEGAQHTEDHTGCGRERERQRTWGLALVVVQGWSLGLHGSLVTEAQEQELGFHFPPRCQFSRFPTVFRKGSFLSVGGLVP